MTFESLTAILAMAFAAYAVRASGLVIGRRLPQSGPVAEWLREVPAAILVAVVAPEIFRGGPAAVLGAAVTTLVMWMSRNLFLAIGAGVLSVLGARHLMAGF
ncbi:MAG TPA: AzlD domain-containing protein [Stellaceae bacterium]|nr:AzlD domain-containing protein [Stellaceae bacterium]